VHDHREDAERHAGGNTRASGQSLMISKNAEALKDYQRADERVQPDPRGHAGHLGHAHDAAGALDPGPCRRGRRALHQGHGFSEREAVLEYPEFGAQEAVAYTSTILPIPAGVWLAFKANIDKRPVEVLYETPLVDLIQDPDSLEVFGAVVEQQGPAPQHQGPPRRHHRRRRLRGRPGNAAQLLRLPGRLSDGHAGQHRRRHRVLQKAGAELWHMRNKGQSGGIWPGIQHPAVKTVFLRNIFMQTFSWLEIAPTTSASTTRRPSCS
jgi:hypothetical protein